MRYLRENILLIWAFFYFTDEVFKKVYELLDMHARHSIFTMIATVIEVVILFFIILELLGVKLKKQGVEVENTKKKISNLFDRSKSDVIFVITISVMSILIFLIDFSIIAGDLASGAAISLYQLNTFIMLVPSLLTLFIAVNDYKIYRGRSPKK